MTTCLTLGGLQGLAAADARTASANVADQIGGEPRPGNDEHESHATAALFGWLWRNQKRIKAGGCNDVADLCTAYRAAFFGIAPPSGMRAPGASEDALKVWHCRDCGRSLPLAWCACEPSACPFCLSRSAIVRDDAGAIGEANDGFLQLLLDALPVMDPATIAALHGLDLLAVRCGLATLRQRGAVRQMDHGAWVKGGDE
ncbi:MAG: hypothetical protein AB7K09_24395 [Planctomycetota bacterium]